MQNLFILFFRTLGVILIYVISIRSYAPRDAGFVIPLFLMFWSLPMAAVIVALDLFETYLNKKYDQQAGTYLTAFAGFIPVFMMKSVGMPAIFFIKAIPYLTAFWIATAMMKLVGVAADRRPSFRAFSVAPVVIGISFLAASIGSMFGS